VTGSTGEAIGFRLGTPEDVDWLTDLRIATMGPHLEASGEDLANAEHRARVLHEFDSLQIIEQCGNAIGMVKVVRAPGRWNLVQIQLEPAHQGHGIGGAIISGLLAEARAARAVLFLSVLRTNPAKRLYDRLGFCVVSEKQHSYEMQAGEIQNVRNDE
jgi:ribosomal protein S18 acetylase RimI-like enzyme